MRFRNILLIVFVIMSHLCVLGQSRDSLVNAYDMNTIHRLGFRFIKGNQTLSFHDLQREFSTPYTLGLYQKARRKLMIGRIFNLASLGVFVYSLFHINDVRNSIEYAVGTGVLGFAGSSFQGSSNKYLDQAIWERNRGAIFGTDQRY